MVVSLIGVYPKYYTSDSGARSLSSIWMAHPTVTHDISPKSARDLVVPPTRAFGVSGWKTGDGKLDPPRTLEQGVVVARKGGTTSTSCSIFCRVFC